MLNGQRIFDADTHIHPSVEALEPYLKADYILANPPFNVSDWGGERLQDDRRWQYGVPLQGNANFAWVQHMVHHLAPYGIAGFVLANGSMSSNQSGEGEIRRNLIQAGLVDCMVAAARPVVLLDTDTGLPLVPRAQPHGRGAVHRCAPDGAHGRPHAPRADRRRDRPHRRAVA